jgi:probable F420-dependent oxidoreductase
MAAISGSTTGSVWEDRHMKIGIQMPEAEYEVPWRTYAQMARLVEEAGFDSLWLGDHLIYEEPEGRRGPWECWSLLAALAAVTERVSIGPLVAATPFHNPAMLAKKAATVDEISGGRLVLGLGAGWNRVEFDAFGFPYDHRVGRFTEAFTIIRTLLQEGRIDFDGKYYTMRDCELLPRPTRPGGPPLMIGSIGPEMLKITLPHVVYWNAWYDYFGNDPAKVPSLLASIDAACAEAGRNPGEVEKTIALLLSFGFPGVRRDLPDNPIGSSREAMAEALKQVEEAGVDHLQLVLEPITLDTIAAAADVVTLAGSGR